MPDMLLLEAEERMEKTVDNYQKELKRLLYEYATTVL